MILEDILYSITVEIHMYFIFLMKPFCLCLNEKCELKFSEEEENKVFSKLPCTIHNQCKTLHKMKQNCMCTILYAC